jgi:hypothetical protein
MLPSDVSRVVLEEGTGYVPDCVPDRTETRFGTLAKNIETARAILVKL